MIAIDTENAIFTAPASVSRDGRAMIALNGHVQQAVESPTLPTLRTLLIRMPNALEGVFAIQNLERVNAIRVILVQIVKEEDVPTIVLVKANASVYQPQQAQMTVIA